MSILNKYPYTDFHEMNLDYVLSIVMRLDSSMDEFKVLNSIRFEGEWNIERAYQAWSLVDTPEHNGYIAIKPVPIGINITNEDYWRQVANYSELYADIQNRIIDLEKKTTRKYVIMADSYGNFNAPDGNHYSWTEYVINTLGLDAVNLSVGNRGFVYNPVVGTFLDGLQNAVTSGLIPHPEEITDIVVAAGANDMAGIVLGGITKQNILNAIETFSTYVKNTFPRAKLGIGMIGATSGNSGPYYTAFYDVLEAYKSVVHHGGFYIANSESILMDRTLISVDGVHPTPEGFNELYHHMNAAFITSMCSVQRPKKALLHTPIQSEIGSWNIAPESYVSQSNNDVELIIKQLGAVFTFTVEATFNDINTGLAYGPFTKLLGISNMTNGPIMGADIYGIDKVKYIGDIKCSMITTTGDSLTGLLPIYAIGHGLYLGLPSANAFISGYFSTLYGNVSISSIYTIKPSSISIYPSTFTIKQDTNMALV